MDFHVTVDFNDDILFARAEWTEEALRELVRGYAERDIRAVHWIDYGGLGDGFWDAGAGSAWSSAAGRFVERVPDPLAVVADECHRRGIRAYSVLKVFDLAMGMPWSNAPVGVPPEGKPRLAHIGGTGGSAMRAIVESPGIRSRLHPSLIAEARGRPIRTIRLWHESARLGEVGPPAIFVSTA